MSGQDAMAEAVAAWGIANVTAMLLGAWDEVDLATDGITAVAVAWSTEILAELSGAAHELEFYGGGR